MGNKVIIGGMIKHSAYIQGDALCVDLNIYRSDLMKEESLTIHCYNKDLMKRALNEIVEGSYFFTSNAYLTTKLYKRDKEFTCSECTFTQYDTVLSERTEVVFNDFCVLSVLPGEFIDGINKVYINGNICSHLNYREKDGRHYVKYKLGVNKSSHSSESSYPFVVSFGREAELAHKFLDANSKVFVSGAIQERNVKQSKDFICPQCQTRAVKKTPVVVREVIASDVVYLDLDKNTVDEETVDK